LFRNGALEIVTDLTTSPQGKGYLPSRWFEEDVFEQTRAALEVLQVAEVAAPVVAMLSFTGIKGWKMAVDDRWNIRRTPGFDRDPLLIPEMLLQSLQTDDVRGLIRPMMDDTWRAGGHEKSDYYDDTGKWIGRRS
jgi:hypothetical protein